MKTHDSNLPLCANCGKHHAPLTYELGTFGAMTHVDFCDAVRAMTVNEFLCYFPDVNALSSFLGSVIAGAVHPWHFMSATASLFGTMAFDAEMQVALKIDPKDERPLPTFDDRLDMFVIIARKFYEEMVRVAKDNPEMYHEGTNVDGSKSRMH